MTDEAQDIPTTPINKDLIEKYFNHEDKTFGLAQLTTLLDHERRQTQRAEYLCRAFMDKMVKLEVELQKLKSGEPLRPSSSPLRAAPTPAEGRVEGRDRRPKAVQPTTHPQKPTVEGLDL